MLRILLLALLGIVLGAPVAAQGITYYVKPRHGEVRVYAERSVGSKVLDVLNPSAVLITYDDPRDAGAFLQVAPAPGFFNHPTWGMGFVRVSEVETDRHGHAFTAAPLPRQRWAWGLSALPVEASPTSVALTSSPAALVVQRAFGPGGFEPMPALYLAAHLGAPTRAGIPALGLEGALVGGYAFRSSVAMFALEGGPTLGFLFHRSMGLVATGRTGAGVLYSWGSDGGENKTDYSLFAPTAYLQATAGITLGAIRQLRLEAGYHLGFTGRWDYKGGSAGSYSPAALDGSGVERQGYMLRVTYTEPLGFRSRTPESSTR